MLAPTTPAVSTPQPHPRNTSTANSGSPTTNYRRSRRGAVPWDSAELGDLAGGRLVQAENSTPQMRQWT